jgi:hypothetical protein
MTKVEVLLLLLHEELCKEVENPHIKITVHGAIQSTPLDWKAAYATAEKLVKVPAIQHDSHGETKWINVALDSEKSVNLTIFHI